MDTDMLKRLSPQGERGQAMLGVVLIFTFISVSLVVGGTAPLYQEVRSTNALTASNNSYFAAEAGTEDVVYRVKQGMSVHETETLTVGENTAVTSVITEGAVKIIETEGTSRLYTRAVTARVSMGTGASFFYGVQTGEGGFSIQNSASVIGNLYSNGPITGANSNLIQGSAVSAGSSGLIDGLHTTVDAFAHTIRNATVGRDAYYQVIQSTAVSGTSYPGSSDLATTSLPIADSLIDEWESDAAVGGTLNSPCPYKITGSVTLGPKKINCNLEISGSGSLILTGPLWVVGNITIQNSSTVRIAASVGDRSVALIADNPSNRSSSSRVILQNSAQFLGTGGEHSFVLVISRNTNAEEEGEDDKAIILQNSAHGDVILYAGHGEVEIQNSVELKEVAAYKVLIKNSAEVIYETGIADLVFTSGPAGGYEIQSWSESE